MMNSQINQNDKSISLAFAMIFFSSDGGNAVGSIRSSGTAYGASHTSPCFERRLMCRRELLFLGVGAANSTSILDIKITDRQVYREHLEN